MVPKESKHLRMTVQGVAVGPQGRSYPYGPLSSVLYIKKVCILQQNIYFAYYFWLSTDAFCVYKLSWLYKYLKCIYFKWAMPYTISEPYNLYGAYLEN